MTDKINLDNITIVLKQPKYSENIGAAARAMRNMGIEKLIVVDPFNYDLEKALKLATHVAADIIEKSAICSGLKEALAPFNYVVGCTARIGGQRQALLSPGKLAQKLILLSPQNSIAVLFGPEDSGLLNEDLRFCHSLVNIPTAGFSSINLAQAVMVMCYEMFQAGRKLPPEPVFRLASRRELDGMYDQVKDVLVKISYLNPENPDYWMNKLRYFFSKIQLRAREVNIIRGICRQVNWYGNKCFEEGKEKGKQ